MYRKDENLTNEFVNNLYSLFSKDRESGEALDPLACVISYNHMKFSYGIKSLKKITSNTSSASSDRRELFLCRTKKENIYYAKKNNCRNTKMKNPAIELIASIFLKVADCTAPKQKIFVDDNRYIYSASKAMEFDQVKGCIGYIILKLSRLNNLAQKGSQNFLLSFTNLAAAMFFVCEADRNSVNYFLDKSNHFGNLDHNLKFRDPIPQHMEPDNPIQYNPAYAFIASLCGNENIFNVTETGDYKLNLQYFSDNEFNKIKENYKGTYIFLNFIRKVEYMLKIPDEIIDYIFSKRLLGNDFKTKLSLGEQEEYLETVNELKYFYYNNLSKLRIFFQPAIDKIGELEESLKESGFLEQNNLKIPSTISTSSFDIIRSAINDPVLKILELNLHDLKKLLRDPGFINYYINLIDKYNNLPVPPGILVPPRLPSVNLPVAASKLPGYHYPQYLSSQKLLLRLQR